jgi:hypothetical protein
LAWLASLARGERQGEEELVEQLHHGRGKIQVGELRNSVL